MVSNVTPAAWNSLLPLLQQISKIVFETFLFLPAI